MAFKDIVKKKIPARYRSTPEFNVFLSMLRKRNIKNKDQLNNYLAKEIKRCNDWFKKNKKNSKEGTMRRWLAYYTKKLDFLKLIKNKVLKYL